MEQGLLGGGEGGGVVGQVHWYAVVWAVLYKRWWGCSLLLVSLIQGGLALVRMD